MSDSKLANGLIVHLRHAIHRLKFDMTHANPLNKEIHAQYDHIIEGIKRHVWGIEENYQIDFTDDELSLLGYRSQAPVSLAYCLAVLQFMEAAPMPIIELSPASTLIQWEVPESLVSLSLRRAKNRVRAAWMLILPRSLGMRKTARPSQICMFPLELDTLLHRV